MNQKSGGKWISKMGMKKGALHADLGVPMGQTIPKKKIEKAEKAGGKVARRAELAETLGKLRKRK